jgi:transcriptional regulator with PAS, ATPase and Fis domain
VDRETFQKIHGIIGESPEIGEIVDIIQQVAPTDLTVLITGESGTGKEVIARAIYNNSKRASKDLVTVNCGAIPEGILESELFGNEKGAYTGAHETRKGYFELADGGTIFLDEIGEIQPPTQVKFLRVLENGEFMKVGSPKSIKVNVRVIAATNRDLETEVQSGKFRSDLYYRLRTINIKIPPLRQRKEDIPLLFDKFVEDTCKKHNIDFKGITQQAISLLMNYPWPGNVRELRNIVENLVVLEKGHTIEANDILRYIKIQDTQNIYNNRNLPVPLDRTAEQAERELILRALLDLKSHIIDMKSFLLSSLQKVNMLPPVERNNGDLTLKDLEKNAIKDTLEKTNFNKRITAKKLGISERTLYRKMKNYDLEQDSKNGIGHDDVTYLETNAI